MIELTLPYPPSVNRTLRAVGGRVILSKRYRDWILAAGRAVAGQVQGEPQLKQYRLWIEAIAPDRRRRDRDKPPNATRPPLTRPGVTEEDAFARAQLLTGWHTPPDQRGPR